MAKAIDLLDLALKATAKTYQIDYMEYANDAAAQAAYVSDAGESIDQQQTTNNTYHMLGDSGGNEFAWAQSFILSGAITISAVALLQNGVDGSPTGNWTYRIETDSSGHPSGTLANVNATVSISAPGNGNYGKGTFATPFDLSAATTYWLVASCDAQSTNVGWQLGSDNTQSYANGTANYALNGGAWNTYAEDLCFKIYGVASLQSYSEATIKTQGSYALKGVATITSSLNKTLTRTVDPVVDLTGKNRINFDIRSSRTGGNLKLGIHDSGGTTTEITPEISVAGSNGDIEDEDMSVITDWADQDSGTGESSQVTFDDFSCMKLDSGGTAGASNYSRRVKDIGTFGTRTVFTMKLYHDSIGTQANLDTFNFSAIDGTTGLTIIFASNGLFIYNGTAFVEAGTDLVLQDVWQEWTFDVDWTNRVVDVYLKEDEVLVLKASGVDCSATDNSTNGTTKFIQGGNTLTNQITYVDWFKAGSALNANEVNTFKTVGWDISGVSAANKNAIDSIIITVLNADVANTFYIDNIRYR